MSGYRWDGRTPKRNSDLDLMNRRRQRQHDWPEAVCYVLLLIAFVTGAVVLGVM